MFGIGWTEFIFIALILLLFVGPKHLPKMMRTFGRVVGELKMASRDLRRQIEVEAHDLKSPAQEIRDMGNELMESMPSPYDEIEEAQQDIANELKEIDTSKSGAALPEASTNGASPEELTDTDSPEGDTTSQPPKTEE